MPLRTCPVCEFWQVMDDTDSLSKAHPHCNACGLLFGDGHLAVDTNGLCQYCIEEETGDVNLDAEDSELDMEELC